MKSIAPVLRLTEEEYLENERIGEVRHEYLGGLVYAMAGASATHNLIALTLATRLRAHLRGKGCQVFISDMKVKIAAIDIFYYPDVMVTCDPADNADYFRTSPVLIIEVASPTTAVTMPGLVVTLPTVQTPPCFTAISRIARCSFETPPKASRLCLYLERFRLFA